MDLQKSVIFKFNKSIILNLCKKYEKNVFFYVKMKYLYLI